MELVIGHSPDPDDAFMFYAMTRGKVDTFPYTFRDHLEDIQSLNERALRGEFEVSAISLHQYPYVADRYAIMASGASMGDGYGPIVVGRKKEFDPQGRVALPGARTSAALLFALRYGSLTRVTQEAFDAIPALVRDGQVDFGVLIHEGQLTYAEEGLELVEDLGAWWLRETGLPTPLGINVIRRDVPDPERINAILKASIAWGLAHPDEAVGYAMRYGRGLDRDRADRFIRMYVNDYTVDLGDRGRAGVREFLRRGVAGGFIPEIELPY